MNISNARPYSTRALRQGNWKVVQRSEKNQGSKKGFLPIELYNLNTDLGEENDIAAQHPEVVEKLMNEAHTPLN